MEGLLALDPHRVQTNAHYSSTKIQLSEDSLVIEHTMLGLRSDTVNVGFDDLYKSLTIKAQKIVDKLNEMLKGDLPNGLQGLKPEEVTPEATASRIVSGATAFFDVFAKQNPDLSDEELINKFMETIRSGIDQGYEEAVGILGDLGAFEFDGVKAGIEETKKLIEEKLKTYEAGKRKELGLDGPVTAETISSPVRNQLLAEGGTRTLNVMA